MATEFDTPRKRHERLSEFKKLVKLGEFECEHNPTCSMRNPNYNPSDPKAKCTNTATHVETIRRRFAMGTYIYEMPLCDDHKGWHF